MICQSYYWWREECVFLVDLTSCFCLLLFLLLLFVLPAEKKTESVEKSPNETKGIPDNFQEKAMIWGKLLSLYPLLSARFQDDICDHPQTFLILNSFTLSFSRSPNCFISSAALRKSCAFNLTLISIFHTPFQNSFCLVKTMPNSNYAVISRKTITLRSRWLCLKPDKACFRCGE